jgi:predicted ATP-grasp superfamily ATP-dependent carboligase
VRVFVYEYTCNGAVPDFSLPCSLRTEGRTMLSATLDDVARIPNVEVATLDNHADEHTVFRQLSGCSDWSLIIAPETDGILATRCRWVDEAGGRLLGPTQDAVLLAGDKLVLCELWREHGVPTPPCRTGLDQPQKPAFPLVLKPRYGAGSQDTFLVRTPADWDDSIKQVARPEELLVQPYVQGVPVSVSFLIGPKARVPLLPSIQHLSDDGRFRYLGGYLPIEPRLAGRAVFLAERAIEHVPGLAGYLGVDLILGTAEDGSQDVAVEINPRLTTSYIGLRALSEANLADTMIQVASGSAPATILWRDRQVEFETNGNVRFTA